MNNSLKNQLIEGILFLKGKSGIKADSLSSITKIPANELQPILQEINEKYKRSNSPFLIKTNGEKIRITLNKETSELISKRLNKPLKVKLSKATIEVLTIISYYQPVTKSQIEKIRKSSSDYIIQRLQNLELIESLERAHSPGNPRLWTTTNVFLEAFDLNSIKDLPNYEKRTTLYDQLFADLTEEEIEQIRKQAKQHEEKVKLQNDLNDDDTLDVEVVSDSDEEFSEEDDYTLEITIEKSITDLIGNSTSEQILNELNVDDEHDSN